MKTFSDYLTEAEYLAENPAVGDVFELEIAREEIMLESYVVDIVEDGIVIQADETMMRILTHVGYLTEDSNMPTAQDSTSPVNGRKDVYKEFKFQHSADTDLEEQQGIKDPRARGAFDDLDAAISASRSGQAATTDSLQQQADDFSKRAKSGQTGKGSKWSEMSPIEQEELRRQGFGPKPPTNEAEYQGRNVPLGKPMKGDVKKSKVYVKNAKGNVVKVNFGDPNMKIKKSNPKRRKSFRARHNCANPGPRTSARYWSCRAW